MVISRTTEILIAAYFGTSLINNNVHCGIWKFTTVRLKGTINFTKT